MSDTRGLVERLRAWAEPIGKVYEVPAAEQVIFEAAARIEELDMGARNDALTKEQQHKRIAELERIKEQAMRDSILVEEQQTRTEELERALRKIVAIELTLDYAINAASEMKRIAREAIQPPSQPPGP